MHPGTIEERLAVAGQHGSVMTSTRCQVVVMNTAGRRRIRWQSCCHHYFAQTFTQGSDGMALICPAVHLQSIPSADVGAMFHGTVQCWDDAESAPTPRRNPWFNGSSQPGQQDLGGGHRVK